MRAIDEALGTTEAAATRKALEEARATLSPCLQLNGVDSRAIRTSARRARKNINPQDALAYLRKNPGSGAEQVAEALGTDTASSRPVMRS